MLCVYAYTLCHSTCVEVRAQLMGVISSFLLCGAWQQALFTPWAILGSSTIISLCIDYLYAHLLIFLVNTDYLFLGSLYIHIRDLLQMLSTAFYLQYLIQRVFFHLDYHIIFYFFLRITFYTWRLYGLPVVFVK